MEKIEQQKFLRKLYKTGRIILPKGLLKFLDIKDEIGISYTSDSIILSSEYSEKVKIDGQGGVILDKELIENLNFEPETKLEITYEDDYIVITKPHICKIRNFRKK